MNELIFSIFIYLNKFFCTFERKSLPSKFSTIKSVKFCVSVDNSESQLKTKKLIDGIDDFKMKIHS